MRSARVMSSTSRHVVTASGAPSTSAVIVTTRSVDCRIRRRTGGQSWLKRKPTPRTVAIRRSPPILRRSQDMCMSSVLRRLQVGVVPHLAQDLLAGDDLPGPQQQHPQQLELLVGQADLGAVDEHAPPGQLHAHAPDLDGLRGEPAQQRADPGQQLGEAEGLADVVVGAGVEADDEVDLVGAGGEHEDGEVGHLGPDAAADLEAVHAGQAEVEHQQVDVAAADALQRAHPVVGDRDVVALALQRPRERLGDRRVVLGEQDRGHDRRVSPTARAPAGTRLPPIEPARVATFARASPDAAVYEPPVAYARVQTSRRANHRRVRASPDAAAREPTRTRHAWHVSRRVSRAPGRRDSPGHAHPGGRLARWTCPRRSCIVPADDLTDLGDDLALALRLADTADAITLARFRAADLQVTRKPDRTPVTDADTAAEDALRAVLGHERPGDAVLGEERGGRASRRTAGAGCSTRSTARRTSPAACPCGPR